MYKFFGEDVSISRIHGQARTINLGGKQVTIYPMYHPAAALRQGSVMHAFEEDFKKFKSLIDKNSTESVKSNAPVEVKKKTEQLELI